MAAWQYSLESSLPVEYFGKRFMELTNPASTRFNGVLSQGLGLTACRKHGLEFIAPLSLGIRFKLH
jgi:hypothetical protein